jgi:hypothetical protein
MASSASILDLRKDYYLAIVSAYNLAILIAYSLAAFSAAI